MMFIATSDRFEYSKVDVAEPKTLHDLIKEKVLREAVILCWVASFKYN